MFFYKKKKTNFRGKNLLNYIFLQKIKNLKDINDNSNNKVDELILKVQEALKMVEHKWIEFRINTKKIIRNIFGQTPMEYAITESN